MLPKMILFSSMIVFIITLSLSPTVSSFALGSYRKALTLVPSHVLCDYTSPCGLAICTWRQEVMFPDDTCDHFLTGCQCPQGTQCLQTNPSHADTQEAGVSVFEYHCQQM